MHMTPNAQNFNSFTGSASNPTPWGSDGDLVGMVSKAASGDRGQLRAALDRLKERIHERVQEKRQALRGAQTQPAPAAGSPQAAQPLRAPPPAAAGPVSLRMPSGKVVRVTISPSVARRSDLTALARVTDANHRLAFAAIERQRRAVEDLARAQRELAAQLAELQEQSDAALTGLLKGLANLRQEAAAAAQVQGQAVVAARRGASAAARQQARVLRDQSTTATLDKLTAAVSSMQTAAFGDKGQLFSTNNLLLGANQLVWSFIDPLLKGVGLWEGSAPSPLAYLAPVGTLATGQAVLAGRQKAGGGGD
jgi:hypothetical protein